MSQVGYDEAWEKLEDITGTETYDEMVDDLTGRGDRAQPDFEILGDRAVFYVQVSGTEHSRAVIGEYRESRGLGPVPWDEDELENLLDGRGEVEIRDDLLEPREINYSDQRHHT
jgi:hypothetical protein